MPNTVGGSLGGSSLPLRMSQASFDMQNESDVISLLKQIHQSPLETDSKNHLRDLVFSYRNSQAEADLLRLQKTCALLGITIASGSLPEVKEVSAATPKKNTLGIVRPKPTFAKPVVKPALQPVPVTVSPKVSVAPEVKADVQEIKVQPKTEEQPQKQADVAPVEAPLPPQKEPAVPKLEPEPVNPTERIKEIKRLVNEQVGNPVNLIDADNEKGREYMNALLDAMKKSNGGTPQEVREAMDRLEAAFVQVQGLMQKPKEVPQPTPAADPQIAVQENTASPVEKKVLEVRSVPDQSTPVERREPVKAPIVQKPHVEAEANVAEPEARTLSAVRVMPKAAVPPRDPVQAVKPEAAEVPSYAKPQESMHSVAKEKLLQDLLQSNREKESKTQAEQEKAKIEAMDPLLTPEVTAGLNQLLSEWGLFKSSGIFGTGPSGKDHSLYIRLAPLTMAAVIAGRFEGATPAIKQSITDYMNGWRYEDGVVHELGETFEHYLRRVIMYILQKQKQKIGSR